MHHITHKFFIYSFFIVYRKRRARGKMFKLTRINSVRLLLSILVIVILPSTCTSTMLLDPLSPGKFLHIHPPFSYCCLVICRYMFAIDYVKCVCNQFKSIEMTEMIVLLCAAIFMHRFMMLLGLNWIGGTKCIDVSLENTFNVPPHYTHSSAAHKFLVFYEISSFSTHPKSFSSGRYKNM